MGSRTNEDNNDNNNDNGDGYGNNDVVWLVGNEMEWNVVRFVLQMFKISIMYG